LILHCRTWAARPRAAQHASRHRLARTPPAPHSP